MPIWRSTTRYTLLPSPGIQPWKQPPNNRRNIYLVLALVTIISTAAVLRLFDFSSSFPSHSVDANLSNSSIVPPEDHSSLDTSPNPNPPILHNDPTDNHSYQENIKDEMSIDEIRAMVATTKGFFSRDYSLGLGWNNVRYIIEASVLQAQLLNRTLVIPSFVYARSCEYELAVCADQAYMVNRGAAIGWSEWSKLPIEQQMGWRIPITEMLNLTQLRRAHPVVLTSDYLRYYGLPESTETSSGWWDRTTYHRAPNPHSRDSESESETKYPSLFVIENSRYDPEGTTRVDKLPEDVKLRGGWILGNQSEAQSGKWQDQPKPKHQQLMESTLPSEKTSLDYEEARAALKVFSSLPLTYDDIKTSTGDKIKHLDINKDEDFEKILNYNGWEVLHTFEGAGGMDFVKHVVVPTKQVASRQSMRGFLDDFAHMDAEVIVLEGETHLYRKPGAMRFTTAAAREDFARVVLHHVVPLDKVYDLARKLDDRISALNGGRQWVSAHMRRGDFVAAGWAWGNTHEAQLDRVKRHLDEGRKILRSERPYTPYSIPGIHPDTSLPHRDPPLDSDRFFIATDERDPEKIRYFLDNGAIVIKELLTYEDRHEFGWGILFTDILGLVEQATLARGTYFYGAAMSSFTGGVFNMRAVLGAELTTGLAD
ncbi:hypothetical protein BJ138DRAFT_1064116 [Hygrophoropsis aurantiaca]|uniref:Uncharacterized protein n=1 Tax=Hygrophoropsis aurantiaca TaxID=72124 RepID=A0ACB8AC87_9AGAM|nr:hypothetical protein BJ138DRAFT_1064116 [Hygrophoropsis aurantiaca]